MNSKQRCLARIVGQSADRVPVFPLLMFFAQKRLGVTYRQYATSSHVLAEAQLQIREKFAIDAITSCSDAFRITADLGAEMVYPEDQPPHAARPLVRTEADVKRLRRPDVSAIGSRMADRVQATREMAHSAGAECLVLGWVDMPFAEACSVCGVQEFMMIMYDNPGLAHQVLEFLTGIVTDFAIAQLEAGAPMIGAGDAAASLISPALYQEFALPYEQRVNAKIHFAGGLAKLHICGNTSRLMPHILKSGADLINVDHMVELSKACQVYGSANVCFKGNLDPVADLLQASPAKCQQRAVECLRVAANCRYMLSAGCEVPAATTDEVFAAFCDAPKLLGTCSQMGGTGGTHQS